jgi:hypothetical protein
MATCGIGNRSLSAVGVVLYIMLLTIVRWAGRRIGNRFITAINRTIGLFYESDGFVCESPE